MAFYKIAFTLNGVRHYTTGTSSYPSDDMMSKPETWNEDIVRDNVMMFVGGYMDIMHLDGRVNPNSVYWELYKREPNM